MTRTILIALLSIALLAVPAVSETIYLRGGDTLEGEIKNMDADSITLSPKGLEGSRIELRKSQISAYGLYLIRMRRIDPDSWEQHEALGDWAGVQELCCLAREQYEAAVDLFSDDLPDTLGDKLTAARNRCAREKQVRSERLVKEGRLDQAEELLQEARRLVSGTELEKSVAVRIESVREQMKAQEAAQVAAQAREGRNRELLRIDAWLETVGDLRDQAQSMRRLAFLESGDLAEAEDDFLSSIKSLRKARRILDRTGELPEVEQRTEQITAARERIVSLLGEVYSDIGHHFIVKGNLIRANHYMGLALAIDPNDPRALRLRKAIAVSASDDGFGRRSSAR